MTTANDWSFHFDDPVPKFLDLPNDIMERICQYLPAQADKSQACLIHSAWQPAAMNVLWEWPRFRYPNNLRAFMNIIRHSKRLALLVHDIHLVFPDTTVSVFAPVAKSNLERHKSMDFYLTKPELINMIVKVCEKLQTLTIYGWNIDPGFLENLGITGTNLTNLHIIGANPRSNTISIHRLLSRLTSLSLDGNFKLSEAFVGQLVNRETRLTHIQLSLSGLDRNTLMRICNNRNHLKLENLALTDAENIQDSDVEEVVKSFPKLKTLCIEGAVQLTDLSLFYAVSNCNDLMELYIRCDSRALNNPRGLISATFDPLSSHIDINLRRLVLENVLYDDTIIDYLANSLAKLKVIGLKNCPNMTNRTLEALVMSCNKLQAFYIRDCPGIGLEAFTELKEVTPATSASLTTFYIANSGPTTPASVYNLCVSSPKLHTLSIEGYTNINDSVVGTFNTVNPVGGSKNTDLVVLDQKSIDALINTDHPDLMYIGESRTLSGYQISLLANRLEMSYHDLIGIMDDVAEVSLLYTCCIQTDR
jgi:hypothetical protein